MITVIIRLVPESKILEPNFAGQMPVLSAKQQHHKAWKGQACSNNTQNSRTVRLL